MHATSNWIELKDGKANEPILKHFQEHGTHDFLCKVDQGYGAGLELRVMKGCHVYACLKFNMRSIIYAFARVYTEEELKRVAA